MNLPYMQSEKSKKASKKAGIKKYVKGAARRLKRKNSRGLLKTPAFYFALAAFVIFLSMSSSLDSYANVNGLDNSRVVFFNSFFDKNTASLAGDLFSSANDSASAQSPDFKIIEENTLAAVPVPSVVAGKVLGDTLGAGSQSNTEISEYTVQPGDTFQSIADSYGISVKTLLLANELTSSSVLKVGQTLAILPVDGLLHVVKTGDTVSAIAEIYKVNQNEIVAFNNLVNQGDIYIGDILIVPGGVMPKKAAPSVNQVPLADNYFIFPVQGKITQGIHYYNAIDVANKCGTPIYAAAAGVVQRVKYGWNFGGGNFITILHPNGVVTYYGHMQTILVKPGDKVYVGQNVGLVGGQPGTPGAGISTGCHLHFGVVGARNPLSGYALGSNISYK